MMRVLLAIVILVLFLTSCETVNDNNPASSLQNVLLLDAVIPHDRYVELLSNRWSDEEVPVDLYTSGTRLRGTMEAQGAGSRYHSRWSFKLELDEGNTLQRLNVSNLSAQIFDDSRLRTLLAVEVFAALGFHTFDFHPVFLKVNGRNFGLYLQIERFERPWFERRGVPVFELIKCGFGARFSYKDGLHLAKYFEKEIPDNDNLNNFGDFIRALDEADPDHIFEDVGRWLDIQQYLRYHAASSVLNHVDGFTNNLFFYRDSPGTPYRVIPWDFDKLMYEPNDVGLMGGNDIIWKLLQNDSCVTMYKQELRHIIDSVIVPERLFPVLDAFTDRISAAHQLDPELGKSGIDLWRESNRLKMYLMQRRLYFRNNIATITRLPRQ
jgi:spore coat protein H